MLTAHIYSCCVCRFFFSELKLIISYLRSTMYQQWLNEFVLLLNEKELLN